MGTPFQIGDFVYAPVIPKGKYTKLDNRWEGPYEIVGQAGDAVWRLATGVDGESTTWAQDRLKLCSIRKPSAVPTVPASTPCVDNSLGEVENEEVEIWEDSEEEAVPVKVTVPPLPDLTPSASSQSATDTTNKSMGLSRSTDRGTEATDRLTVRHSTPVRLDHTMERIDLSPIISEEGVVPEIVEASEVDKTPTSLLGGHSSGSGRNSPPGSGLRHFTEDSDPNVTMLGATPLAQRRTGPVSTDSDSSPVITRSMVERGMEELEEQRDHYLNGSPVPLNNTSEEEQPISSRLREEPPATERYGHPTIPPRRNAPRERNEPDRLGIDAALLIELVQAFSRCMSGSKSDSMEARRA